MLKQFISKQDEKVLPPPEGMAYAHFGFNEVMADLLWLRYIQDSWNCYSKKLCYKDWGYKMLDQSSQLAPKFKSLYIWGATSLSILLDDDYGAKEIFDRGLENYPNDWLLNYRAGYHYLIELNDNENAARLLTTSSEHGAPFWTKSLAARLYERSGKLEVSEKLIESMIFTTSSEEWKSSLKLRLAEIQKKKKLQKTD